MKKYITTKTHPNLKEGTILNRLSYNTDEKWYNAKPLLDSLDISGWEGKGWIKEYIEPKEFTKSDLEDVVAYFDVNNSSVLKNSPEGVCEWVDSWLKFSDKLNSSK